MTARRIVGASALVAYVALIVLANWLIGHYGFIPVGFGLLAPAGTYAAGAVFVARDVVQVAYGRWAPLPLIAAGALLSWLVSPSFALASAVAFGLGELTDWAIFTPLFERKRYATSFVLANSVAALVDTLIFLQLAFGSTAHWQGTVVGKLWMAVPLFAIRFAGRPRLQRWFTPALAGA